MDSADRNAYIEYVLRNAGQNYGWDNMTAAIFGKVVLNRMKDEEAKTTHKKRVTKPKEPETPKTDAEIIAELRKTVKDLKTKVKEITNNYDHMATRSNHFETEVKSLKLSLKESRIACAKEQDKIKALTTENKQAVKELKKEIAHLKATGVFPSDYKPVGGYAFKSLDRLSTIDLNTYDSKPEPDFRDLLKPAQPDEILGAIDVAKLNKPKKVKKAVKKTTKKSKRVLPTLPTLISTNGMMRQHYPFGVYEDVRHHRRM
jgi:hypothetical protein